MKFIRSIRIIRSIRNLAKHIRLRTWIALGIITILLPIAAFTVFYWDSIMAAIGGSTGTVAAHWSFDEGTANTCTGGTNDVCDNSGNGNDGAFGASNAAPTIRTEDLCVSGKCLLFDGTDDTVTVANTISNVRAVTFWVKVMSTSTTQEIMALNGTDTFSSVSGTVTVAGFGTETIYVDGKAGVTTLSASRWHHVAVTTGTNTSASAITIGNISTNYGNIFLDEVKLFTTELSADQVKAEFAGGAAVFSDRSAFLSDGLVGYWPMDEASANSCSGGVNDNCDKSGNGNDGAWQGNATNAGGKYGNAVTLDGNGDYVNIADSSTLQPQNGSWSVSVWANPPNSDQFGSLVTKRQSSSPYEQWNIILCGDVDCGSAGQRLTAHFIETTGTRRQVISTADVADGNWHMYTAVFDKEANTIKLYMDGIPLALSTERIDGSWPTVNNTDPLRIGSADGTTPSYFFNGRIDEVRLYSRTLSDAEVRSLYNWAPGPVGYWKFDDNTGQTPIDSSGYGSSPTLGDTSAPASDDPTWRTGKFGSALNFDGIDDYVDVDTGSSHLRMGNQSFSISAWIIRDTDTSHDNIYGWGDNVSFVIYDSDELGIFIQDAEEDGFECYSSSNAVSTGVWHHVAAVIDRLNANNCNVYIDGAQATSFRDSQAQLDSVGSLNYSGRQTRIGDGRSWSGFADEFDGSIDEVKIYNYARTPQQIIEDMNGGHPVGGSPVGSQVAYWKFDEMYGTTAYDTSPHGNDLTLQNSSWTQGKINGAIDLESDNSQYAYIANRSSLSITGSLSVSAWIKPESTTADTIYPIVSKGTSAYQLLQYGDEIRFTLGSSSNHVTTNNVNLLTGSWYHIIGVYDAQAQTAKIYINGQQQETTTSGTIPSSINNTASDLNIGTINQLTRQMYNLYTSETSYGTGSYTTNSFTPVNSSLLVVSVGAVGENTTNDIAACLTISDSQSLTWTSRVSATNTNSWSMGNRVWTAPVTTGSSMTITVDCSTTNIYRYRVFVANYTGYNTTTPTGATASNNNGPTDGQYTITLSANPALNSEVLATLTLDAINNSVAPGTNWTERADSGDDFGIQTQTRNYPDSTSVTWNDVNEGGSVYKTIATALEINSASSTSNFYDGVIDEVQIYNAALTPEQVKIVYNANSAANFGVGTDEKSATYGGPGGNPPVAYWNFNENTGTSAYDKSGNGYTGTLTNGPTWATGKYGSGVSFDGGNDMITTSSDIVTETSAHSVTFWVYPESLDNDDVFFDSSSTSGFSGGSVFYYFGGALRWCNDPVCQNEASSSTNVLNLNTWNHIAAIYDGEGTAAIYVNGVNVTSDQTLLENDETDSFLLGNDSADYISAIDGIMDEVKVFNYALTPAQIAYDFNRGAPTAWYKMDDCTGTTVNDLSTRADLGNPLNGTWSGPTGGNTSAGSCTTVDTATAWYNGRNGKINYSLDFDGTDDVVTVTNAEAIDFDVGLRNSVSFAFWIYAHSDGEGDVGQIFNKGANTWCRTDSQGTTDLDLECSLDLATTDATLNIADALTTNTWHHIVMAYTDDSDDEITIYIDGQNRGSSTNGAGSPAGTDTNNLLIGGPTTANFDGQIDDFRVFTYELTETQVRKVMNDGSAVRFGPATGSP